MGDKMTGVLTSATKVLTRAVELDRVNKYVEACVCYQEGLQLLMDVLKGSINLFYYDEPCCRFVRYTFRSSIMT